MKIAIVGMEYAGKKTLFRILSNGGKNLVKRGSIEFSNTPVLDGRVTELSRIFNPKKTTYAQLEFIMTPSLSGDKKAANQTLNLIHAVDGLILLVRDFELEGLDPSQAMKDFSAVRDDLLFNDLMKVESLIEKTEKRAKKMKEVQAEKEYSLLVKCKTHLDTNASLQTIDLNEEEKILIRNFDFLTRKPVFVLVNVSEDKLSADSKQDFGGFPNGRLALKIEEEIFSLPENEQKEFLDSLGLKEPGLAKIIHACYAMTNLISFFTTGEDEVKAWTLKAGSGARTAAGVIHSDIERGFIRAEVIGYDDFIKAGSDHEAKKLNLLRLEGKDYVIKDGEIVHFRFNV